MDPFQMVVTIVVIVTGAKLFSSIYKTKHGIIEDKAGNQKMTPPQLPHDQDEEIKGLKERVKVLERIVTDNNKAIDLDREIESLRHK